MFRNKRKTFPRHEGLTETFGDTFGIVSHGNLQVYNLLVQITTLAAVRSVTVFGGPKILLYIYIYIYIYIHIHIYYILIFD